MEGLVVAVGGGWDRARGGKCRQRCDIPLGILPMGSGNDYAITQGIL